MGDNDPLEGPDEDLWARLDTAEGAERGWLLQELGERKFRNGDFEDGAALLESAAQSFLSAGLDSESANSLYWLAQTLRRADRADEAITVFRQSSDLFREVGDESQLAACHQGVGITLSDTGRDEEALADLESAERLHEAAGDLEESGRSAMARGQALGRLGRQAQALEVFRRARSQFRRVSEASLVVWADDRAAAALIDLGQVREAIEILRNCLLVMENSGRHIDRAYAAYRLGWTLRIDDRNEEALPYLSQAHAEYAEEGNLHGMAGCDLEAGHAYSGQGDWVEAERLYVKARATFDALGDDHSMGLADAARAHVFRVRGDIDAALHIESIALEHARETENGWLVTTLVTRMADDLVNVGRAREALDLLSDPGSTPLPLGDELHEQNFRRYVHASAALAVGDAAGARALTELGISELTGTDAIERLADMHRVHSEIVRSDDVDAANRELAFAVALYLAAGQVEKATENFSGVPAVRVRTLGRPGYLRAHLAGPGQSARATHHLMAAPPRPMPRHSWGNCRCGAPTSADAS